MKIPRTQRGLLLRRPCRRTGYGQTDGCGGTAGAVPRQVIRFLNDEHNRALLRGVIASGNRNFGEAYGRAGDVIARKCGVPWLYRFELMGTQSDIENVRKGVTEFWQRQPQNA